MNHKQRLTLLLTLLTLLIFTGAALAQSPAEEADPTQEPTAEPVAVIDAGEGAQTDITVNVPAAEVADTETSAVNYLTLAIAIGMSVVFLVKTFRGFGGEFNVESVTGTIETFSGSEQFNNMATALTNAIPQDVHQRALDTIDSLNERLKDALAVGGAITAAVDKITDKPTPPQGS